MDKKNTHLAGGAALVALSALGYATNPILGKVAYHAGANAMTLGMIRFTTATVILWAWLIARREAGGLAPVQRIRLLLLGSAGMAMVALLYFTALEHIGASLATGLFYTYPAMVTVIGLMRGERLTRAGYAGLLLTLVGTWALLGTDLGGFTWTGALLILGSSAVYTAYIMVSDGWTSGVPAVVSSAHVSAGAALVYLVLCLVSRQPLPAGAVAYAAGAGLALCSTVLALITFFAGLVRVGPTRAAIISTLEPVFTTLLAVLVLGERLSLAQAAGIGLVAAGAVAAQVRDEAAAVAAQQ